MLQKTAEKNSNVIDIEEKLNLSQEQKNVVSLIDNDENVFITGPAGTGKSHLLSYLREFYNELPVTSTTGISAVNVQGTTINSWAGLGLCDKPAKTIANSILFGESTRCFENIVNSTKLAIDEVSMLSADNFDLIDTVFRHVRNIDKPFGGIQLILFGDFLQLPPIDKTKNSPKFAFEADAWTEARIKAVALNQSHRQKDPEFDEVLRSIRVGECTPKVSALLNSCYKKEDTDPSIKPVVLHPKNINVDIENESMLKMIPGDTVTYMASSGCVEGHYNNETMLKKNCLAPENLQLKIGAQVMLLRNLDITANLVNGAVGEVVECSKGKAPVVEFGPAENKIKTPLQQVTWEIKNESEKVVAWYVQYPLKLAYSITVHKTQGMTLDKIKVYLKDCFAPGQSYTALSRVKTKEGLFIESGDPSCLTANKKALQYYDSISN